MGVCFLSREVAESWLSSPIGSILGEMHSDFDRADPLSSEALQSRLYEVVERILSSVEEEVVDGVEESVPLTSLEPFFVEKREGRVTPPSMLPPVPAVTPGHLPEIPSPQWSDRKVLLRIS
jgi:hypothetical protein